MRTYDSIASNVSLYIDIETCVPNAETVEYVTRKLEGKIEAPANYKDPAKIQEYVADKIRSSIERLSLSTNFAEIVCICVLEEKNGIITEHSFVRSPDQSDAAILEAFSEYLQTLAGDVVTYFGKGIKRFDFPIIRTRLLAHGLISASNQLIFNRYETGCVRDLEDNSVWPGNDGFKEFASLADIAFVVGLGNRMNLEFTGANVQIAWEEGDIQSVVDHCLDDVRTTREIFRKIGG